MPAATADGNLKSNVSCKQYPSLSTLWAPSVHLYHEDCEAWDVYRETRLTVVTGLGTSELLKEKLGRPMYTLFLIVAQTGIVFMVGCRDCRARGLGFEFRGGPKEPFFRIHPAKLRISRELKQNGVAVPGYSQLCLFMAARATGSNATICDTLRFAAA